jgi:ATP-dependent exoDNAse (exonuclease V) alpha subunit
MRGANVGVDEVKQFSKQRGYVRSESDHRKVTLPSVLRREWEIVTSARDGMCAGDALVSSLPMNPKLDDEQQEALRQLLQSGDSVSVFRGGAGTGKSFVLGEVVQGVRSTGRSVIVLAPQRQQVVDLEKAGFPTPTTVTDFLMRGKLVPRSLVVVDEAGQIGGKQMHELLRLVSAAGGRVILSGDTRQHGPVEASDALVAIERYSGIRPVELHSIRRQDPRHAKDEEERTRIAAYRDAVAAAAAGKLGESFEKLEKMGAVVSCGLGQQSERLADEYLRLVEGGASTVVVSQTWAEVHRVNERVRAGLKERGLIAAEDKNISALEKLDLTNAQKRDARFYDTDSQIVFNQRIHGTEAGSTGRLFGVLKGGVLVEVAGRLVNIPNHRLDRITVCRSVEFPVATGDRLHLKSNRKLASGGRVTNGELVAVRHVAEDGAVELEDGRVLDRSYREFIPGYAVTSYGSQGKTVDYVLFSDSTVKAATNSQQWYVTISRGRKGLRIITPDKEQLRENILRSGHRTLALDIAKIANQRPRHRWLGRLDHVLRRFGNKAAMLMQRARLFRQFHQQRGRSHEQQINRVLDH